MTMTNQQYLETILPKLKQPMQYKWRVQSFSKQKPEATCVAYIDARDVMDRLDEVCAFGWERSHAEVKGHIYSTVTIIMPDGSRINRTDCGTESETEAEKGESSDSFKRAAVNWGVGRFLYDLEIKRVPASDKKEQGKYPHVVDAGGKRVWDLSKHINSLAPRTGNKPQAATGAANANVNADANAMFDKEIHAINTAATMDDLLKHWKEAKGLMSTQQEKDRVEKAKNKRKDELLANGVSPPTAVTPQDLEWHD